MNSKQRVFAFLEGKEVDRIPNLNIVMLFAADYASTPYSEFCFNSSEMVRANIKTARKFGIDVLTIMSDPYTEAHDFGLELEKVYDDLPMPKAGAHLITDLSMVDDLTITDPYIGYRMSIRLDVIKKYKEIAGDEFPIIGWVEGPIAEASDLRGINDAMLDIIIDETGQFDKLLDIVTKQAIVFAKAQIECGADIIGIGDAAASLLPVDLYESKILPRTQMIIDAVHEAGAKTKLHICGNINHLLPSLAKLGSDIIDIDYMVDMKKAVEIFEGISIVNGNIDPVGTMLEGSPSKVETELIKAFEDSCGNAILSCGCEVPKKTPLKNMEHFHNVIKDLK